MMEQIISFARENKFSRITLYSRAQPAFRSPGDYALPEEKLIRWYESFGFEVTEPLYRDGEIKVYDMRLRLEAPGQGPFQAIEVSHSHDK
jgi:ribosomal protein S18 acetylase RimI-like enzyme